MDAYSNQINKLIEELSKLPGIGAKSAQRLAFHIINMPKDQVQNLAGTIVSAREKIRYCSCCWNLTDSELCPICANPKRDHHVIMVVETPRDLAAYEKTQKYEGVYHVLHGAIDAWHRSVGYSSEGIDDKTSGRCDGSDHCDQFHP